MNGVIYKITNLLNGKIYVGQTINFQHRIHCHKCSNRTGVDAAIKKYGWENFKIEVIEECPIEKLDEREIFWIFELNCKSPNGYNLTNGGDSLKGEHNPMYGKPAWNRGIPCSKEKKLKISATLLRKGIKPPLRKGAKFTEEQSFRNSVTHKKMFYGSVK